jgi:hypothetical protein
MDKIKKRSFEARKFFLTISKIESEELINKERLRDLLIEKEDNLSHYMIGEELHVDGSKHYHIYLKYSRKRNFSPLHFDYLGKHGKLEVCRSPRRSFMYISKEDRHPLANFDYEGGIFAGKAEEIALYLSQIGKKYDDLFIEDKPSLHALATKWRSIKSWNQEYEEKRKLAEMLKLKRGIRKIDKELMKERLTRKEMQWIRQDEGLQKIIKHINQMIDNKWSRPFKTKNLLIWSKGVNKGKTSLIRKLMEYCPMYGFPRDEWFHGYKSGEFWGILWNEMTLVGTDLEMLKNFFEGTAVNLEVKGSKVEKNDNPEVFMTSNRDLEQMMKKRCRIEEDVRTDLEALRARIDEVNVDEYENIFFLSKLIVSIS